MPNIDLEPRTRLLELVHRLHPLCILLHHRRRSRLLHPLLLLLLLLLLLFLHAFSDYFFVRVSFTNVSLSEL